MPVRVAVFIDGANVYRAFKTVFGDTSALAESVYFIEEGSRSAAA